MNDSIRNTQCFDLYGNATRTKSTNNTTPVPMDIEPIPESDDEEFDKLLWSIDDDTLFYPFGLTNHGTGAGKTVFVTWSADYLLNFVFKRSRRTKEITLTKVRLAMPAGEIVREMLILELNALLLMESGRVHYFSSVKSIHAVPWLSEVRCMAKMQAQCFSVIRLNEEDNTLHLEVYRDVVQLGKSVSTLEQSYDITYDAKNLFNCQWRDERFTLTSCKVTEENLNFLQLLVGGESKLKVEEQVHIFTVSGMGFTLTAESPSMAQDEQAEPYSIQPLFSFASNIEFIQLDCAERRCLVFLQCGSIEIFYASRIVNAALQRTTHHSGSQYTDCVYAPLQSAFYFTDEQQVAQLQFHHDTSTDTCSVRESFKAIPGMVACTWVETLQQLICLSCNNVFYKITFPHTATVDCSMLNTSSSGAEYENLNALYELTPKRMTKLLKHAQVMEELERLPGQLHAAIEEEYVQQQLLAVVSKQALYKKLCRAELRYSTQLPENGAATENITYVYTNHNYRLHGDNLLAYIRLRIKENEIFESTLWHLHIDYGGNTLIMHIPRSFFARDLCVVIPLMRHNIERLLPSFTLQLYALGRQHKEFVAIGLPVELEMDASTYKGLFSINRPIVTLCNVLDINQLIKEFQQHPSKETKQVQKSLPRKVFKHHLLLPPGSSFNTILAAFNVNKETLENSQNLEIYFTSQTVQLSYDKTSHSLTLESADALALYYTKMHLLFNVPPLSSKMCSNDSLNELIMQLQCDLARCSSVILQLGDLSELQAVKNLHFDNLQRIYAKLRKEACSFYS